MNFRVTLISFFLLLPWVFFGVDLGDQSYFSTVSWLLAFHPQTPPGTHPLTFEAVPTWFGFFLDSLLWKVLGSSATFLELRLAWVAFSAIGIGHFAFLLQRLEIPRAPVAALLGGLVYGACGEHFVFTYNHFPAAFSLYAVLCLALNTHLQQRAWSIAGGVWIAFSIGARLPMLPLWFALLGVFAVAAVARPTFRQAFLHKLPPLFLGTALGFALIGVALWISGQANELLPSLQAFVAGVSGETNARYSKWQTLEKLGSHVLKIALGASAALAVSWITNRVSPFSKGLHASVVLAWVAAVIAAVLLKYGILLSFVIGAALVVVLRTPTLDPALKIMAVFVLFAPQMGTFLDGVQGYKYTAPLLIALAWGAGVRADRVALGLTAGLLFLGTRLLWVSYPYPDYSLFQQTAALRSESLQGIRSYPLKAEVLDGVVSALHARGLKPGDPFLVFTTAVPYYPSSWAYLATRTVPLLHDPGLVEYPGSRWPRHRAWIEQAPISELPRLFLRHTAHLPRPWSLNALAKGPPAPGFQPPVSPYDTVGPPAELLKILQAKGYRSVWNNGYYEIWERPADL